jgi:pilus assembly protein Flp/PilA
MLFLPHEEGQGLVEYALILVLVAIVVIAILLLVGPAVGNVFSQIVYNL